MKSAELQLNRSEAQTELYSSNRQKTNKQTGSADLRCSLRLDLISTVKDQDVKAYRGEAQIKIFSMTSDLLGLLCTYWWLQRDGRDGQRNLATGRFR